MMSNQVPLPAPLPVVTVTSRSAPRTWRLIEDAIDSADFIALDLELSGLGNRKALYASSVEDRYQSLCQVANSHAVISLGVACFQWAWTDTRVLSCQSHVFDILLLCQEPYLVDPAALSFLIRHGFDFNQQYSEGLPFSLPAESSSTHPATTHSPSLQDLFLRILHHAAPVVVHNGLVDLVFLYRSFYGPLPRTLAVFVADLFEMFPGGVFDTKNMAESQMREPASFLEYLFHKCWRANYRRGREGGQCVDVCCSSVEAGKHVPLCPPPPSSASGSQNQTYNLCQTYASHGYCRTQDTCPLSHNILHVLDAEEAQEQRTIVGKRRRRRKRRQHYQEGTGPSSPLESLFEEELAAAKRRLGEKQVEEGGMEALSATKMAGRDGGVPQDSVQQQEDRGALPSGHRAGGDAYMTGYCFCCYALRLAREKLVSAEERGPLLEEVKNKVSLGGKDFPLLLSRSSFTTTSPHHKAMAERMKMMYATPGDQ